MSSSVTRPTFTVDNNNSNDSQESSKLLNEDDDGEKHHHNKESPRHQLKNNNNNSSDNVANNTTNNTNNNNNNEDSNGSRVNNNNNTSPKLKPTSSSASVDHEHCTHNHNKNSFKEQPCNNYKLGHCRQGLICPNQHTGTGNITRDAPDHVLALAFKRDFCVNFTTKGECNREKSGDTKCLLTHPDRERLLEEGRNIYMQRKAWSENMLRSGRLPEHCNAWCHPEHGGCKRGVLCPMKHDPQKKGRVAAGSPTWRQALAWNGAKMCLKWAIHHDCPDHVKTNKCKFDHLTLKDLEERGAEMMRQSVEDDSSAPMIPGASDDPLHPPLFLDIEAFEQDFLARKANPKHGSTTDEERRRGRFPGGGTTGNNTTNNGNSSQQQQQQQQHHQLPSYQPQQFSHPIINALQQSSSSTTTTPITITTVHHQPQHQQQTRKVLVLSRLQGYRDLGAYSPLSIPPPLLVRRDPSNPHLQQLLMLPPTGASASVSWPPPLIPLFKEEEIMLPQHQSSSSSNNNNNNNNNNSNSGNVSTVSPSSNNVVPQYQQQYHQQQQPQPSVLLRMP